VRDTPLHRIIGIMRTTLSALLDQRAVLLADGATGTNYFQAGLAAGEPPEFWNVDRPECRVCTGALSMPAPTSFSPILSAAIRTA
jgi:hypothetical protein